ncbi:unnamed protein product, partial [Amoebophrya sp. A120]|eukprot:GSA120T00014024001.1
MEQFERGAQNQQQASSLYDNLSAYQEQQHDALLLHENENFEQEQHVMLNAGYLDSGSSSPAAGAGQGAVSGAALELEQQRTNKQEQDVEAT